MCDEYKDPISQIERRGFIVFPLRIDQIRFWKLEVTICDLQGIVCDIKQNFLRCQIDTLKKILKMFELTSDEFNNLKSQFVISSWGAHISIYNISGKRRMRWLQIATG